MKTDEEIKAQIDVSCVARGIATVTHIEETMARLGWVPLNKELVHELQNSPSSLPSYLENAYRGAFFLGWRQCERESGKDT